MSQQVTKSANNAAGQASPSFENLGGSAPESYERYFVPAIRAPLAGQLVEQAALRPGERAGRRLRHRGGGGARRCEGPA